MGPRGFLTPEIPGIATKTVGAHVVLGLQPDFPPFATFTDSNPKQLAGFNVEFAKLMLPICNMQVDTILYQWDDCWGPAPAALQNLPGPGITEYIGKGILQGEIHGCTSYTHTVGERNLALEFTHSILGSLRTAGILTRLDSEGRPIVSPRRFDYTGIKLGDVTGFAPTADTFQFTTNWCAEGGPQQFRTSDPLITSLPTGNAAAISALRDGTIDALYIYADTLFTLFEANPNDPVIAGFGTEFAYIQTGLDGWSINGTTLAISKRGSGLADVLNPCIEKVAKTQEYTELCERFFLPSECIQNEFSTPSTSEEFFNVRMDLRTDELVCTDGYCRCDAMVSPSASAPSVVPT